MILLPLGAWAGVDWIAPPTLDGPTVHALVEVREHGPTASLELLADGRPLPTTARPLEDEGTTTVVSLDASGSFRKHYARSLELISPLGELVGDDFQVGLMVFGRSATTGGPTADPLRFRAQLDAARRDVAQQETRLAAFLLAGVDEVAAARPLASRGFRRLVVFTDAGEESDVFSSEDVIEHATERRVRIDMVVFARDRDRSYARDLDRLLKITRSTGGRLLEVHGEAIDDRALVDLLGAPSGRVRLAAPLCGDARPSLTVRGPDGLTSPSAVVSGVLTPCEGSAQPAAASDPRARRAKPPAASKAVGLFCLVMMLATFVGLGGVAVWFARRNADPEADPPSPPAPTDAPVVPSPIRPSDAPPPDPKSADDQPFSMRLPERHLVAVGGDLPAGTRWRFTGRILRVGANPEDNDVVVDLPQVSGTHARFELYPSGTVYVEDLGSSNGTFVDGLRLSPGDRTEVPNGVQVSLSSQVVLVVTSPDAAAQKSQETS